jgi:hydroxypyruvate isomerase
MMFTEHPFLQRFGAAARAGFDAVEIQFPYDEAIDDLTSAAGEAGVECVLINSPVGDVPAPGIAGIIGRERLFRESLATAVDYARALSVSAVNVLAGTAGPGDDPAACRALLASNLALAAEAFESHGITVCLEAVNTADVPGYLVPDIDTAADLVTALDLPNLGLQFDLYHAARTGLDVEAAIRRYVDLIRHVQFADCPGRHEPGTGQLNLRRAFALLDELGYDGWVGAEYRPSGRTEESLQWRDDVATNESN